MMRFAPWHEEMDKHEIRRVRGTWTAEARERWQQAFEAEERAIPENIARLERRRAATAEQTTSGELRRAIASCGLRMHDFAERAGISEEIISDFMCGDAPLDFESLRRICVTLTGLLNRSA